MADAIRVNGNQYGWGSIILKIEGEAFYGFTAVSHSQKRERTKAYGMGKHHAPRGRPRGKYTVENAKLTGWKSSVQAARDALAAKSATGKNYGDVVFQIVIQYVEDDESPITEELVDCVWAADSTSHDESPDPLKEDFEVDYMYAKRNGATLFDNSDGTR
jgi:hypothetical protein